MKKIINISILGAIVILFILLLVNAIDNFNFEYTIPVLLISILLLIFLFRFMNKEKPDK